MSGRTARAVLTNVWLAQTRGRNRHFAEHELDEFPIATAVRSSK